MALMNRKRGVGVTDKQKATKDSENKVKAASSSKTAKADQKKPTKTETAKKKSKKVTSQLEDLKQKNSKLEDKYLRAEAEIANMQTRYKKEQDRLLKYQGQEIARAILPAIDNLNRALAIEVNDEHSKQLKKGVEMVAKDIQEALSNNGVQQIDALNKKFDPKFHQAVKTVPVGEGQEPETVVQVFQEGYMLKDRVLRPSMVVVAQ